MWSWIPIIGPFIQGAVNMFSKFEDASVQKTEIAATKDVALRSQDVAIIQTRADLAKAFAHDVGVVFARDVILNWYAIYVSLIFYDSCFRNILPPYMTWRVLALPDSLNYLCAGIIAFLFVAAWRGK
jgi:hypothetical protein